MTRAKFSINLSLLFTGILGISHLQADDAYIWNAKTGEIRAKLPHVGRVSSIAWSRNGQRLVTTSGPIARIWNKNGTKLFVITVGEGLKGAFYSYDDHFIATSSDGGVGIWDAASGAKVRKHMGFFSSTENPMSNGVSTAREILIIDNRYVKRYSLDTGELLGDYKHHQRVSSAFFGINNKYVTTLDEVGTAAVIDKESGELLLTFTKGKYKGVNSISWNNLKDEVIIACGDGTARVWDVQTRKERLKLEGINPLGSAYFSGDGKLIATCIEEIEGAKRPVKIWSAESGKELVRLPKGQHIPPNPFDFDKLVLTISESEAAVRVYRARTGELVNTLRHTDKNTQIHTAKFQLPDLVATAQS